MSIQISACLIVRDEAENLDACLRSIRPFVDELVIVDTGSTDDSPTIAKKHADVFETFLECNDPDTGLIADFSAARNRSFDLASGEWVFWCDADDIVKGGENLRRLANESAVDNQIYLFPYEYAHDHTGRAVDVHYRERLLRPRDKFRWRAPVHEGCSLGPHEGSFDMRNDESVLIVHQHSPKPREIGICRCGGIVLILADASHKCIKCGDTSGAIVAEQGRNLRILKKYVPTAAESDVRALYYLGKEYLIANQPNHALRYLRRYVELAAWSDEKGEALMALAKHYFRAGDYQIAIDWCHQLIRTKGWAQPYWWLAKSYYHLGEDCKQVGEHGQAMDHFRKCCHFAELGLHINFDNSAQTVLHNDPRAKFEVQEILNVAYSRIGALDKAIASCQLGLEGLPESQALKANLETFLAERSKRDHHLLTDDLVGRGVIASDAGEAIKKVVRGDASAHLQNVSADGSVEAARVLVATPVKRPDKLDLVIFTGPALERWNGDSFKKTGLGGSETMAWELGRRLAKLGNSVRIYGDVTATMEGVFDGVQFLNYTKFKDVECDVLVCSRTAQPVNDKHGCKFGASILWCHDLTPSHLETMATYHRIDRWLALTPWHKQYLQKVYPLVDHRRILVTRNGIDPERFSGTERRNPHRAIYSSSPDRGLPAALEAWPMIRKRVSDAELHVFYGFFNWEEACKQRGDTKGQQSAQHLKARAKATEGVILHERVPQGQLAREFMKSGTWLLPTWWSETSCCHPDTRISIPGDHHGGPPTVRIADLVGKSGFPVYAFNEAENRFQIATCKRVWETKIADELVELDLDSGETLRVTPEHKILTFDGDWVEAGTLVAGDSLRALHYRYNVAIKDGNGDWVNEHRLVGEWKMGRKLTKDEAVDHTDLTRLDNRPEMLTVMSCAEHSSKTHKGKKLSKRHIAKKTAIMKATLASLSAEERSARGRKAGAAAWAAMRAMSPEDWAALQARKAAKRRETHERRMADPEYAARLTRNGQVNGAKGRAARLANELANPELAKARKEALTKRIYDARWGHNHKVVAVRRIAGPIAVYDMEVEGLHNFVADGIVVHNCISGMEAQAAGCRIVCSELAALIDTVGDRGCLISGPFETDAAYWMSKEFLAAFTDATVDAMTKPDEPGEREEQSAQAFERFSLDALAEDWDKMLRDIYESVKLNVVPAFHEPEIAA